MIETVVAQTQDVERGYRGLIVMGLFIIACLLAAIWWLKRQT